MTGRSARLITNRFVIPVECVLDAHSRKCVGWAPSRFMDTGLTLAALRVATVPEEVFGLVSDTQQAQRRGRDTGHTTGRPLGSKQAQPCVSRVEHTSDVVSAGWICPRWDCVLRCRLSRDG